MKNVPGRARESVFTEKSVSYKELLGRKIFLPTNNSGF